ncbi:MAG: pyridoxamine 5'-phosphate oxidase family protein [Atopococcus tabaci]|uniref:Pyridoxamine 5'-phosphate oxidase family protein n=1 Tax=Atopococcus tabaci TaxID=269774 RepID=A0AA43RM37_9LACT|nr:pyridoxamine 5'-phosphate oxidase family protein [Atopococcus tabaci]
MSKEIIQRIKTFLEEAPFYAVATLEDGQPRVRPFDSITIYQDCLCILSSDQKAVFNQIQKDNFVEITSAQADGSWIRVRGQLKTSYKRDAVTHLLNDRPDLWDLYSSNDPHTIVYYFTEGSAVFYTSDDQGEHYTFTCQDIEEPL